MKLFSLLICLLLVSCGDDDLPKVENLSGFRVLAIVADNPEVSAGGTADLQLLVSDFDGDGRTISGSYRSCTDPGIALGAEPSCEGVSDATASTSFNVNFSALGNAHTGLDANTFTINVPATILDDANSIEEVNGIGYLVVFRFTVDGNEVRAFKNIIVSNRTTANSNPGTPDILLNDATLDSKPTVGSVLTINDLTDEESFPLFRSNGDFETVTESYELAWYVSQSDLDASKVEENGEAKFLESPPDPDNNPFVAVAVVRDERGGTSFRVITIN